MKFGLIGYPVSHSKSPQLFKEAFGDCGDSYNLIERESFDSAYKVFLEEYDAVNVTMPFKETAFTKAVPADRITSIIKATNLLKKENGIIKCYNTDYYSVKHLLSQYILHYENVLIIGCGGAGKAAALAAYDAGFCVSIANRTVQKAEEWVRENHLDDISCYGLNNIPVSGNDIIVYTLPVLPENLSKAVFNGKILIEANYASPSFAGYTQLSAYISGEEWLREQAVFSFKIMREKICE